MSMPINCSGLSSAEAAQRLAADGPNTLPGARGRPALLIALETALEPMFLLLALAAGLYLALGDLPDALTLGTVWLFMFGISVIQAERTERVLASLREMTSPRAQVLRDGVARRIPGAEVVTGDLLLLAEGDRIAADAVVLSGEDLLADESLLTGESAPVRKSRWDGQQTMTPPGGEDLPFLFAGTVLVKGQGMARAQATGAATVLGQLGSSLQGLRSEASPVQVEVGRLVRRVTLIASALCAAVVLIYGLRDGAWLAGLLAGVTLAVALLPVEFPVVLTVFLALGAWRISQRHVLTRRMAAVEALGAVTLLCVDKTGTLTANRMRVAALQVEGHCLQREALEPAAPWPAAVRDLLHFSTLASALKPHDPMEQALYRLAATRPDAPLTAPAHWQIVRAYALSPELLAMTQIWRVTDSEPYVVAAKGAPEAILDLCHLKPAQAARIRTDVHALAAAGLRVIAVARGVWAAPHWPDHQHAFDYAFLGLIGLEDPLREEVPAAVAECRAAGIRVVMLTGDHLATARAIAAQAGIADGEAMTGAELAGLDAADRRARLAAVSVFARIMPSQKLALVQAWQANGEVVAMTGDGVNDAPALRAAQVGIAMGARGTDVAREAAALVLTDDNFASIVAAVRLGRRIFDNLRTAIGYLLAAHVPIAGAALVPLLLDWPLVLFPVHVMLLEMIIDPACSIVFELEPAAPGSMRRPPRPPGEGLLRATLLWRALVQGGLALLVVLLVYISALGADLPVPAARALAVASLVSSNLAMIVGARQPGASLWRKWRAPNLALRIVVLGALLLLLAALAVPPVARVFQFAWPGIGPLFAALLPGALVALLASPRGGQH